MRICTNINVESSSSHGASNWGSIIFYISSLLISLFPVLTFLFFHFVLIVLMISGSCLRNMDIKGVGKNAGRSLRTSTNITRRQKKAKQEGMMGSTTDSIASLKPYMEKTVLTLQAQPFISKQIKKCFRLIRTTSIVILAPASLTQLNLTHLHVMMMTMIIALKRVSV